MDCLRSENLKEVRAYSSFFDPTLIALVCQSIGTGRASSSSLIRGDTDHLGQVLSPIFDPDRCAGRAQAPRMKRRMRRVLSP